jgi:hypothetical protein
MRRANTRLRSSSGVQQRLRRRAREDRTRTEPQGAFSSIPVPRRLHRGGDGGARLDAHGRVDPRPGVASASNLLPKSATSDGDKTKGPALPVAVFGEIPWQ